MSWDPEAKMTNVGGGGWGGTITSQKGACLLLDQFPLVNVMAGPQHESSLTAEIK